MSYGYARIGKIEGKGLSVTKDDYAWSVGKCGGWYWDRLNNRFVNLITKTT